VISPGLFDINKTCYIKPSRFLPGRFFTTVPSSLATKRGLANRLVERNEHFEHRM